MSAEAQSDPSARSTLVRDWIEKAVNFSRRHAPVGALALWGAAVAVLAVHSAGVAVLDSARFAMLEVWLVGLGCLALGLCPLGRCLSPTACLFLGGLCFTAAALLTGLTLCGEMAPKPMTGTFGLILPLALGIQAVNAADAELQATRREETARQGARLDSAAGRVESLHAATSGLDRLEAMSVPELETLACVVGKLLEAKRCDHGPRRLASVPGGGPLNGSRHRFGRS